MHETVELLVRRQRELGGVLGPPRLHTVMRAIHAIDAPHPLLGDPHHAGHVEVDHRGRLLEVHALGHRVGAQGERRAQPERVPHGPLVLLAAARCEEHLEPRSLDQLAHHRERDGPGIERHDHLVFFEQLVQERGLGSLPPVREPLATIADLLIDPSLSLTGLGVGFALEEPRWQEATELRAHMRGTLLLGLGEPYQHLARLALVERGQLEFGLGRLGAMEVLPQGRP